MTDWHPVGNSELLHAKEAANKHFPNGPQSPMNDFTFLWVTSVFFW